MDSEPALFDHLGRPVALGSKLGAGGEGAVFEVAGDPAVVAKLYHKPPADEKATKLRVMAEIGAGAPALLKFSAWPAAALTALPSGPVVGFLMPRKSGYEEIHHLYGPAHRKVDFPHADYAFLVQAARNCELRGRDRDPARPRDRRRRREPGELPRLEAGDRLPHRLRLVPGEARRARLPVRGRRRPLHAARAPGREVRGGRPDARPRRVRPRGHHLPPPLPRAAPLRRPLPRRGAT